MGMRTIRGAVTVKENTREAILEATGILLQEICLRNEVAEGAILSVIFSATPDLDAVYPAEAARARGWGQVSLLCVQEMAVQGSLPACIRVMMFLESTLAQDAICHCYLEGAAALRPDLADPC